MSSRHTDIKSHIVRNQKAGFGDKDPTRKLKVLSLQFDSASDEKDSYVNHFPNTKHSTARWQPFKNK